MAYKIKQVRSRQKLENVRKSFSPKCGNEVHVVCENHLWNEFYPRTKTILMNNTRSFFINGAVVRGYTPADNPNTIWLRDHTHNMKGVKYFERDLKSVADYFFGQQLPNGSYYDYLGKGRSDEILHVRIDNEADVEYHMVDLVHQVWQATGDDDWYLHRNLRSDF